jgi:predicted nucleic acid-binding protein
VIDETLTLLRARGEPNKAISFGRQLLDLQIANVVHVTPSIFSRAWDLFREHPARQWSFTDCTSKIVMDDLHIKQALCLDHHFAEFGAINVIE